MIMVLIHFFMWYHAYHHKNLVVEDLDPKVDGLVHRITILAVIAYALAILLTFWRLDLALIIYVLIPLPYIFGWVYKI